MMRVLIVAPYKKIFPPRNGGMLRCFHIFNQLSNRFDVTLITYQDLDEVKAVLRNYPNSSETIVKQVPDYFSQITSFFWKKIISLWYKVITSNLRNSLSTDFFNFYFFLKKNKNLKDYDVIIIENLSLSQLAGFLKKHSPKCRIYYDAHNVDSAIARIDWGKGKISKRGYKHVLAIESSLFKKFDAIWTCSDVDAEQFNFLNEGKIKIKVIPNGTEIKPNNLKIQGNRNKLLFCGSLDYAPNEEGLIWFLKEIWPLLLEKCDDISLTVIGRGLLSQDLKAILCLASVNYQGEVKDVLPFYAETDVVIVPLLSGSGTRLKVLEAMAYNRPIVSTSKGAEGINYERNGHLLIEDDPYSFAKGILELLTNSDLYAKLSFNANLLIKDHYTWDTIGVTIQESILEWKESTSQCIDDGI